MLVFAGVVSGCCFIWILIDIHFPILIPSRWIEESFTRLVIRRVWILTIHHYFLLMRCCLGSGIVGNQWERGSIRCFSSCFLKSWVEITVLLVVLLTWGCCRLQTFNAWKIQVVTLLTTWILLFWRFQFALESGLSLIHVLTFASVDIMQDSSGTWVQRAPSCESDDSWFGE